MPMFLKLNLTIFCFLELSEKRNVNNRKLLIQTNLLVALN